MANDVRKTNYDPMDDFFGDFGKSLLNSVAGNNKMKTDVLDKNDEYVVKAELPGFKKSDIDISYDNDTLTVHAIHDIDKENKGDYGRILSRERSSSDVNRSFYIPGVDEKKISADYDGGVLTITLPKSQDEETQNHHVEIE
ncbi:Hsp20/alpha crystallin family protein [Fructilactobacillus fructivorans]|uniref:Molecular chaperone (Small heat shock protein) n=1 Tax=Fructilactobacillus fructivorans TaxID=1614 RepID=A0A0C1PMK5_9LACO|nr:Hsp20/alpha crystallin family protein [Fructilactobacillus fructivorans]KID41156.1 Molecular chaperone (small heat shock protein) [Fructilactobacillus fructivorans]MCT2867045.1 Hsp20/alpha crystallin family protein [Fructilactobacillus fructivorans]MCT2873617.1 Hsp20/alpha crystallin family protein [Fructilactobacillus fructivorans]